MKKGVKEDEMVGWHHLLDGHECEQTLGDGEGQGSLASCSPWGHKELDTTWQMNDNFNVDMLLYCSNLYERHHDLKLNIQPLSF